MIRKLVKRLNESVAGYLSPARQKIQVPIIVSIKPKPNGLRHGQTGKLVAPDKTPSLRGETVDLSGEGLSFVVPCIRLGENYLVGDGNILHIQLDLPKGKIRFKAVGQRYQPISQGGSIVKYLIGARISQMSQSDREIYTEYIQHGIKAEDAKAKKLVLGATNG